MTTATNNNGSTQRKQLSDQLDRLDHMLDGLSEALNESVADAVKGVISLAVTEAVHAAVREVLASPELLRAALEKHSPPVEVTHAPSSLKESVAGITGKLREKLKYAASMAKKTLTETAKKAAQIISNAPAAIKTLARAVWAYKKPCLVALGVGVLFGATCYLGGQLFSSVAGGVSAAAITMSAMTLPLKGLFLGGSL